MMSSLTMFLYLRKFSGLIWFLISSSATPLLRMSVIIMANFSRAWFVTSVSGTSTSIISDNAAASAAFRAGVYSLASSLSTAFCNSSFRLCASKPARTSFANSSVTSGRERFDASKTSTSNSAFFPANVLSRRAVGNVTETVFVSPTCAPTIPSTSPVMYRPSPRMTSTRSPDAASGNFSPFSPASVAMYPSILTTHASPI
mmetsp:Transcript_37160/g.90117  ORF Transcript_37160/g.90117 Transcript_37160/m.90117 type:complete len:201 (-) Transcript_37160:792-1394(-)